MARKRGYFTYGEGAITHGDEPCEHGIGLHHPQIERVTWPNRWAYYRYCLRLWAGPMRGWHIKKGAPNPGEVAKWVHIGWQGRLLDFLFGSAFPRHPTVWAPLRPEDSIYHGAVEEAEWWEKHRSAPNPALIESLLEEKMEGSPYHD